MELATPEVVRIIVDSGQQAHRRVPRRSKLSLSIIEPLAAPRRVQSPRCRCGVCATCVENARWERIFQEKFADPGYYGFRAPSPVSSLSSGG